LQVMGCSGFLEKPWGFKDDRIVRELLDGVSNEFDNSIRGQPVRWTEECWREVYHFGKGGGGLAGRKDEYVKECFKDLPNPKDGYSIDDCKDPRQKRLLAFLVPIVYPEKPNRITVTWGNTIFGALNGDRKVNWARVITTLVVHWLRAWVSLAPLPFAHSFTTSMSGRSCSSRKRRSSGRSRKPC
jgi:hypothetical protein